MKALRRVEALLFDTSPASFLLLLFGVMLLRTGVWLMPNLDLGALVARNPFANPFPDPESHYLLGNWLGPFLAWTLRFHRPTFFFALHAAFGLAFTALFVALAFRRFPPREARVALILFAALPVSATAWFWIGPDGLTLLLLLAALALARRPPAVGLVGVALGMQHFEQGCLAAAGLLAATLLARRQGIATLCGPRAALALLAGVVLGKAGLHGILAWNGVAVRSGRLDWLAAHLGECLRQFLLHPHVVLWSVLGPGWLVALRYADLGRRSLPFFLPLGALLLLLPLAGDQTRVLAVVTFPLVAVFWLLDGSFLARTARAEAAGLFVVWAVTPWSWAWGGTPRWSALPYDFALVLNRLFGWFAVPPNPLPWPFQ
ncbi:hypothetical protein M0638_26505 [Roseomonas sp. NAR14]|uniref:Uncharacterized protein n=1 Tax=Roseomonas acroporae TaxID=2937791 RepID=A0A9X1YD19_9PROT|nr:hypothetical protein [Roseomonas acroporae]MCK8787911.1 hypothetical protein [Roseomonas acroporae]